MILHNVTGIADDTPQQVHINNGVITAVHTVKNAAAGTHKEITLLFNKALIFPGLINSHDHLDFNLFPQLGNHIYNNYTEWGMDIHKNNIAEIHAVMKVPLSLRLQWGCYKNLLNGVTTVVNHGKKTASPGSINIFQNCHNLHSTSFEKYWKYKLNRPFAGKAPFVMHSGEGTDAAAHKEIDTLLKWNLFKRKLIAVHGVAMDARQASQFSALVWCPASNYFLLNKTAPVKELKNSTPVIFGTDSTLTAGWSIWDHLRLARKENGLSDEELYNALTKTAAAAWQLHNKGMIAANAAADIVVARTNDATLESFYAITPQDILLVLCNGNICLFDESLKEQLDVYGTDTNSFGKVFTGNAVKYVLGDCKGLVEKIKVFYPGVQLPVRV